MINVINSLAFFFVSELKANIGGPADLYVKSGSDINLQCKISQGPHELGNIFWYKGKSISARKERKRFVYKFIRFSFGFIWLN